MLTKPVIVIQVDYKLTDKERERILSQFKKDVSVYIVDIESDIYIINNQKLLDVEDILGAKINT